MLLEKDTKRIRHTVQIVKDQNYGQAQTKFLMTKKYVSDKRELHRDSNRSHQLFIIIQNCTSMLTDWRNDVLSRRPMFKSSCHVTPFGTRLTHFREASPLLYQKLLPYNIWDNKRKAIILINNKIGHTKMIRKVNNILQQWQHPYISKNKIFKHMNQPKNTNVMEKWDW